MRYPCGAVVFTRNGKYVPITWINVQWDTCGMEVAS